MTDYRNIQDIDNLHLIIEKLSLDKDKLKKNLITCNQEKDHLKETIIKYKKENKKITEQNKIYTKLHNIYNSKERTSSIMRALVQISDEFADFTSLERGSIIHKLHMNKLIMDYIKNHHLLNKETKQIIPNTSLKNLLKIPDEEEVYISDIRKYIYAHSTPFQEKAYSCTLYEDGRCTTLHKWAGDY